MKKLILILFFCILTVSSFAQASAASARMFKDTKAWQQREFFRTSRGYTLDTAELYGLIGLSKDLAGHTNWQYSTSNISNTFASLFPILGRTNISPIKDNYFFFQTNTRYSGHEMQFFGSPTFSNNSIIFNGTTQYATLRYFRNWSSDFQSMTPQFLMDSILAISPTDTLAQTNLNYSVYTADSSSQFFLGTSVATNRHYIFKSTIFQSNLYSNDANGRVEKTGVTGVGGLFVSARNALTTKLFINGVEEASSTNASYNFSLARNTTNAIELQRNGGAVYFAGTIQYLAILNRALTSTENLAYYNAVREFIRRKTQ
jgi:hypothetical protein